MKAVRSPSDSDSDYSSMSENSRTDSLSTDLCGTELGWNSSFVGALIDSSISESERLNEEIAEAREALAHSNEEVRQLNDQLAQKEDQMQTLSQEKNCAVATLQTMYKNLDALNLTRESDVDTGETFIVPRDSEQTQVRPEKGSPQVKSSCPLLSQVWNVMSNAWSGYSFF